MGGKAPAAPDPVATANAQGAMNRETAISQTQINAIGQRTPYGSLDYSQEGTWSDGTPRILATQSLSPAEQRQLDFSNQAQDLYGQAAVNQLRAAQGALSKPFDPNLPSMTSGVASRAGQIQTGLDTSYLGGGNGSRDAVQEALMGRMNPALMQQRDMTETKLRNQGIQPGTEAWTNAMRDVSQSENDARMSAIINAGQEQSRVYDLARANAGFNNTAAGQQQQMDTAAGEFGNNARQQSLQEQFALRSQPVNEAAALLTGQQVQSPNFVNTPTSQVAPVDYSGLVMNNYNQGNQNYQNRLAGLYGLGQSAISGAGYVAGRKL